MIARIGALLVCLAALLLASRLSAGDFRPRSILYFDQSDLRGPFYFQIFSALRARLNTNGAEPITLYAEDLDLSRFNGEAYKAELEQLVKEKYRDKPIGVIVAVGGATLELVLKWRTELWPQVPIVFTMVEKSDFERLKPPSDVAGRIVLLKLSDSIRAARAVVPNLQSIVLVGGAWDRQVVFGNWKDEIPIAAAGLRVTDLSGLPMNETRDRVADLPAHSAIIYSATFGDGEGVFYPPATALSLIAEKASRPIIVAAETFLAPGGIGGYVLLPSVMGEDAARLALRILDGEQPADFPVKETGAVKAVFNWPQMQRWGVAESRLPAGSEIRFRQPTFWETYRIQSIVIVVVMLLQTALISILLHERKKRNHAEQEARNRVSELAHANRQASAGELSSSIAHELNQPLGAILTNAETAELILQSPLPDLQELKEILADIKRDDLRANEVIQRLRSFLKRTPFELKDVDLNGVMREVFGFLAVQASARNIALYLQPAPGELKVKGDPVQLQQVILNLIVNSMEAMAAMPYGRAVIGRTELNGSASAVISISDSGPGIQPEKLAEVFDPFFTTKQQGMGIGLSIARTIVQAHRGKIWAENQPEGGAVFHLSMPLALH
jgi:signal transduction histidine kinase